MDAIRIDPVHSVALDIPQLNPLAIMPFSTQHVCFDNTLIPVPPMAYPIVSGAVDSLSAASDALNGVPTRPTRPIRLPALYLNMASAAHQYARLYHLWSIPGCCGRCLVQPFRPPARLARPEPRSGGFSSSPSSDRSTLGPRCSWMLPTRPHCCPLRLARLELPLVSPLLSALAFCADILARFAARSAHPRQPCHVPVFPTHPFRLRYT